MSKLRTSPDMLAEKAMAISVIHAAPYGRRLTNPLKYDIIHRI